MKKKSKAQIANIYAKALFEATVMTKSSAKVFADVEKLRFDLGNGKELSQYMLNPLYDDKDKQKLLQEIAKKLKLSKDTLNCLEILRENRRIQYLSAILDEFVHLYYQSKNMVEITVETVQKFSTEQKAKITNVLENKLKQKVVVNYILTPEILGGLKVRKGTNMFDDTIATKLKNLEIMMKGEK